MEVVTKKRMMIFSGSSYPELAREVADHLGHHHAEGVDRFYVWFADFAPVTTLTRFAEVISALR